MLTDKEYHSLKETSLKLFYEMIYVSNASEIVKYISALTYHLENVRSDYLPKESINPLPEGIDVMMELDRLECFYNESDTFIANTDLYDSVYVNTLLQLKRCMRVSFNTTVKARIRFSSSIKYSPVCLSNSY